MKSLFTQLFVSLVLCCAGASFAFAGGSPETSSESDESESIAGNIDGVVAIVENDVITEREFERIGRDPVALDGLILSKLLMQEAMRRDITISDDVLTANIIAKQKQGINVSAESVYEGLIVQALQQQVTAGRVKVSDNETNVMLKQQLQKTDKLLRLVDLLIDMPAEGKIAATEQLIKTIQKKSKTQSAQAIAAQFNNVNYTDLGWLSLSQLPNNFANALKDAKINQLQSPIVDMDGIHLLTILARKSTKQSPTIEIPETKTSHILVKTDSNPDAKTIIEDLYRQLQAGADFAKLAKQHSDDTSSAVNGGALGWTRPGQMVKAFEMATNATPKGKMSRPFRSVFGYHIVKVHNRRVVADGSEKVLKERAQQMVYIKKASQAWENWLMKLRDQAYVKILK